MTDSYSKSGEKWVIILMQISSYCFSGQSGSADKIQFKPKLSKVSQEVVLQRHLLLENEKKKKDNNVYI